MSANVSRLTASPVASPDIDIGEADAAERMLKRPEFRRLVDERSRFGWILTAIMLVVYFGFIGLIAFNKDLLATKVAGPVTLGLVSGVSVILIACILTGIYVARANTRYDALTDALMRSLSR